MPDSPEQLQQLLHELQVHQSQLEMQNEELRRTQLLLDAARDRYFDLYELAPVGYCTLNEQGMILEANLTAATLLGVARSDLVHKSLRQFIVREDQDVYYRYLQGRMVKDSNNTCDLRVAHRDGSLVWVNLVTTGAKGSAGEPVLRIVLHDVTERKGLDQALQKKNIELELARALADKANLAKSDFLSSMSHELRSPLNAILGFAQLMESSTPAPTPVQQGRIEQILRAGWYLLDLINEVLDLALIESGSLTMSLEPIALPEVLAECQAMIEPEATKNGIQLSFPHFDGPCLVSAERTRLKQVLINLLSNAIKYNKAGGSVQVSCCAISPQRICIKVQDSGEGLPPQKISQLFQPFNRLGKETSAVEGTGIGLVVSRRLVELMGGRIGVQSTVGTGSIFWIELGLVAPQPMPMPMPMPMTASMTQDVTVRTLLYVEDNLANMELVRQLITRRPDMRLLGAEDATSGIAIARALQPDVILMDINLPVISGLQALKILREHPQTAHIPVLALSANAMSHDIEKGLQAGFFAYLTKPIKIDEFLRALDAGLSFASKNLHQNHI